MRNNITVTEWVEMFKAIGLTEAKMSEWHKLFETKYPDAHQSFLEWLGLDAKKIEQIRKKYSCNC